MGRYYLAACGFSDAHFLDDTSGKQIPEATSAERRPIYQERQLNEPDFGQPEQAR